MRRILTDQARARQSHKRGGGVQPISLDEALFVSAQYLIHYRDPLFTAEFLEMLADIGIQPVKLPSLSPNLNAYAERFVRTIKESCLGLLMLFGEGSLRKALREFVAHYLLERNHQGLAQPAHYSPGYSDRL